MIKLKPSSEWVKDRLDNYPEEFLLNLPQACQGCAYVFLGRPDENREMGYVKLLVDAAAETTDIDLGLVCPLVSTELIEDFKYKFRHLLTPYSFLSWTDQEIVGQLRLFWWPPDWDNSFKQLRLFYMASELDWSNWEEHIGIPAWYCTCESVWGYVVDICDDPMGNEFEFFLEGLKIGNCRWYSKQYFQRTS